MPSSPLDLPARDPALPLRATIASALLTLATIPVPAWAQAAAVEADPSRQVDAIFSRWDRLDSPGCAVAVVLGGRVVHRGGYGAAHLEHAVPITPETVFDVGSLSKQFTAATVALLARRGALGLDDDVRRWIPELPSYSAPITIRHLLHHTSGLRDYFTLWSLKGRSVDDPMPVPEVLALIARQRELNFAPGTDLLYSNSNYFLLARVVERAAGRSLPEVARELIFAPLGMSDTDYFDDVAGLRHRRAEGYAERAGGFGRRVLRSTIVGDGGLYTTVDDLVRWDAAFESDRLVAGGVAALLQTPARLASGEERPYALGVLHGTYRGLATVSHGGTMGGYRSFMLRFPGPRLTAIVLCNLLELSPNQLSHRIADAYLGERMEPRTGPVPEPYLRDSPASESAPGPALTESEIGAYVGRYHSDEIETTYELRAHEGRLVLVRSHQPDLPVVSRGDGRFEVAGMPLAFVRDAGGAVTGFAVHAGRVRRLEFRLQR